MTDAPDLSAEAAEELRGQLICQCDDVYRHRNLHSPDCLYHLEPNLDVLVNEITRLRAEVAAAERKGAEGWQTMATAPRDGTEVLVCGGTVLNDQECFERWSAFSGVTICHYDSLNGWQGESVGAHDEWYWHKPHFWMPLPLPPSTREGE